MGKTRTATGLFRQGISPGSEPDYVVVELRHDSKIAFSTDGFCGASEVEPRAASLNKILNNFDVRRVVSHFGMKSGQIKRRITEARSSLKQAVTADYAQSGFVQVLPRRTKDIKALAARLNRFGTVWKAFVAPRPVPAWAPAADDSVENLEPAQGYLHSPPNGIGAMEAWSQFDARGKGVTVCDIEGNWNLKHKDFPGNIAQIGGTLKQGSIWKDHGTAVLGTMISRPGSSGTVGICHNARAMVQSHVIDGKRNTAQAITNATTKLKSGDVLLIELAAPAPSGKDVAMQFWDDVLSAIRAAVAKGVTVVEAAGNGGTNFDLKVYENSGLQKDSGAILVGAGVPPTNYFDNSGQAPGGTDRYSHIGVPRSKIWFSNYGKILNLQAWGWHVATTGYGDIRCGTGQNSWYTLRFQGTSSAAPIVAGAVACLQGLAKKRHGSPLSPARVREILIQTGTSQAEGPGAPLSKHIGPQPNLPEAFKIT